MVSAQLSQLRLSWFAHGARVLLAISPHLAHPMGDFKMRHLLQLIDRFVHFLAECVLFITLRQL